jgi:hypothetical protein
MRSLCVVLVALALCACGERADLTVTVTDRTSPGPWDIPDELNRVSLLVTSADAKELVLERDYPLTASDKFPLKYELDLGKATDKPVRVEVNGYKDQTWLGAGIGTAQLSTKQTAAVSIELAP